MHTIASEFPDWQLSRDSLAFNHRYAKPHLSRIPAIEGYIPMTLNAGIQEMRIVKQRSFETDDESAVKHLSKVELQQLIDFYRKDKEARRKEYVEMFLFALYACGLRLVDILTLQWKEVDMERKTLNKTQVKTRNRNIVPLNDSKCSSP